MDYITDLVDARLIISAARERLGLPSDDHPLFSEPDEIRCFDDGQPAFLYSDPEALYYTVVRKPSGERDLLLEGHVMEGAMLISAFDRSGERVDLSQTWIQAARREEDDAA